MFSDVFNDEEMGKITGIEAKNKEILLTYQNLNDYIKILQDYKNNPLNKNKNQISDDDLLKYRKIQKIKNKAAVIGLEWSVFMLMDKKTTIENLIEKGKANGKLSTKEITDALEELDFDVDQMDTFYDTVPATILK